MTVVSEKKKNSLTLCSIFGFKKKGCSVDKREWHTKEK